VFADKEVCPFSIARSRMILMMTFLFASAAAAQNVTTQHNDIGRTGEYTTETVLAPSNVNTNTFGKTFYYVVDGYVYAQPLYMANITMGAGTPQAGTKHNVVFVATEHDSVYAFDADANLGANGKPLWRITLLDSAHGAAAGATPVPPTDTGETDIVPEMGVTGTPVIDPATNTMYVAAKTKENGVDVARLHALDITTGAEKFGGPVVLSGSVPGNGAGSVSGTLKFDPRWENQRAGLLLLNGIVYVGFGSHNDSGPWHGWVLAYNAATLNPTGAWCSTPNGFGAGIWESGTGLTASVIDPIGHPYGSIFTATGTGTLDMTPPYTNAMDYSVSVFRLDLANGAPTIADDFTPFNASSLTTSNRDQGSGGPLILPDSVSGGKHLLVQVGKSGRVYLFDQTNLGGYNPSNTSDPQQKAWVNGEVYGGIAYWNGHIYAWASKDHLKSFSIANGVLSSTPTSTAAETSQFPGPASSVSANGTSNGIVWNVQTDAYASQGPAILFAHDANNVANLLYSSAQNAPRDNPGGAVKFATPTIANGRVYVGGEYEVSVYSLLNGATQAAAPAISPTSRLFHPSIQVTISDSTPNAQIFYTTDGSIPSTGATQYTGPFTITSTQTIRAMAAGSGLLASTVASETYTLVNQVPTPAFNPAPGDFASSQSVAISTTWPGSTIYYTTNGSTPTTSSAVYTGPVNISSTATLKAIATAPNLTNSAVASGLYTIVPNASSSVDFRNGFTSGAMKLVGSSRFSGTYLRLTDGGSTESSAAWFPAQLNVQGFSTDFTFQQWGGTVPIGDGLTFTIQGVGATAIGPNGGGLGYGAPLPGGTGGIASSIAVKFDLFQNSHEGNNSTGLYTNGASPTSPAITLGGGVNLQSGDVFAVHIGYDGATLTMTITDTATNATFTTSWPINIPATVGGNAAFVGFTGGTGHYTAVQDIRSWTYVSTTTGGQQTAATPVIAPATGTFTSPQTVTITDATSGSTIFYTLDGSQPTTASTQYKSAFTVSTTTTVKAIATAPNFTQSNTATSVITIQSGATTINYASGFTAAGLAFNGRTTLNGTRLRLTDGGQSEASSAWFTMLVNVQTFTTDFSFQLTNPNADGITFTIQNAGTAALGPSGGGLGYGAGLPGGTPGIPVSVAVKFDLFQNSHEGNNSTGLYTNGASPTSPSTTLGGGVNLHSGDIFKVHITYDGTTLTMTITDTVTNATFTTSWPINIPATVGANTALVGFTAGTGGQTAIQEIISWTYGP
jgi:Chitobiase/beta-hexosaminidase C-terminal domain/Legume lectin domain/Fn3 associated